MKLDILCLEGEPLDDVNEDLHWVKYVVEHDRPITREMVLAAQSQSTGKVDLYPRLETKEEYEQMVRKLIGVSRPFPHTRTTMLFEHEDDVILWQMKVMGSYSG